MTTGRRLSELSGGLGLPAAAHLRLLAAGGSAAERWVARSGLPAGSALQHLLAMRAGPADGPAARPGGRLMGVHFRQARPGDAARRALRRRADETLLLLLKP